MKRSIYIVFLALIAVAIVSLLFWLVTGKFNLVAPILGAMVVVILSIKATKNKNF